ncbi:phosphoenolpyruvate carboxykinase (ATP) [Lacticigenium naphthae]|uniref:phosphoenolpyruvate carboxykinase (ATP) n=1 Tax=Lacticigenium naphthae TaxID=515351 RepID=UPI0004026309|nr:phosphoenolpyruvate carboxykinase (ATP) [Lacticigenium naphthae]
MATREKFSRQEIRKENKHFSQLKAVIETAFYGNNVEEIASLKDAYKMAEKSPHTIVTDLPVKHTKEIGIPKSAKVLVENGGKIVGRTAVARRIVGMDPEEDKKLAPIIRQAIYDGKKKNRYKASAYVGLDEDFMVQAHLSVPEGQENNLYSWLLNFQNQSDEYKKLYEKSTDIDKSDIYIYQDPNWSHPDYPLGLAYFDPEHNCGIILGLNYFGELKKGTLTLAWNIANHIGYAACHGGQKKFSTGKKDYVSAFFGLSGSGKSTLTHAKHNNKYDVKVLHDDAFIISIEDGTSIALEPSYFDKTNDYPTDHPEVDYFVTVQNVAVTLDGDDNKVLLTEDLRNGNGRTVKSRYSTPNRVDKFEEPINAIYWIMKDDSLPPLLKVDNSILASTFGATLATKRTSAERVAKGVDLNKLIIEPYANPFRVYPLQDDYDRFKELFEKRGIDCYIINTGEFMGKKITKEVTLGAIESVVDETVKLENFGPFESLFYAKIDGYDPELTSKEYIELVKERIQMRIEFISENNEANGLNTLPAEALKSLEALYKS